MEKPIGKEFTDFLKNLKPFNAIVKVKSPEKSLSALTVGSLGFTQRQFPPLNTNIQFSTLPKYTKTANVTGMMALKPALAKKWDWVNVYPEDNDTTKAKKLIILFLILISRYLEPLLMQE